MMELRKCEFFIIRYVPEVMRKEFVNIGIVLRAKDQGVGGETLVRFTRDWRRVRCINPRVEIASLEALEAALRRGFAETREGQKPILDEMQDTWSGNYQLTPGNARLVENLPAGMDDLMELFVEPRKAEHGSLKIGARQAILAKMRSQFERAGVWEVMDKRIPVAPYTQAGDPLRIDCGYKPNGTVRMFHAVSLDGDLDLAKVLAFGAKKLGRGVFDKTGATLELTAIVEPFGAWDRKKIETSSGADSESIDAERHLQYEYGDKLMRDEDIRVLTTSSLPGIAETARLEMRL